MAIKRSGSGYGLILPAAMALFAGYFIFAAIRGEYGVFRGVELEAEQELLQDELSLLTAEVERLQDRTRRLSDDYLDLDLLDERARMVLGAARPDEVVIE